MYISSTDSETVLKMTGYGVEFSTDNGETWKPFSYRADDTIDSMWCYATEIVEPDGRIRKIDREKQIKNAFNNLEGEDCCEYCRYKDECHGISSNGRGEPIYPVCADALEPDDYMNYEQFKEDYLEKFREENNMEILRMYREKREKAIHDEYMKKREDLLNSNEIVARYNEINNTYKATMEEFVNEEKVIASGLIVPTAYLNTAAYEIDMSKLDDLFTDLNKKYDEQIEAVLDLIREVEAQIEIIPEDGNYDAKVVEVLKNYNILDKKGKINA